jgi:Ca-activated chloride channel homolog
MRRGSLSNLVEFAVITAAVLAIRVAGVEADQLKLGSISGSVAQKNSAGLAGATIVVRCTQGSWTGTTDAGGNFSTGAVLGGKCTITASMTGFIGSTTAVKMSGSAAKTVRLQLEPASAATTAVPTVTATKARDDKSDGKIAREQLGEKKRQPMAKPSIAAIRGGVSQSQYGAPPAVYKTPIAMGTASRISVSDTDTEHNTSEYARIDDNPFLPVASAPLSTFSSDVDTASYSITRKYLRDGVMPPKDAVRVEELINYFSYDDATPIGADPFAVSTELTTSPWNPAYKLLRIGLRAPKINDAQVPARNLVFLLDVSGSMQGANRLPLVKQSMDLLIAQLRPQDRVAIAVYAGASGVALPSTTGDRKDEIRNAVAMLTPGGSTNGAAGINLAYELAQKHFIKGGINRVILATDGDFNVGVTNEGDLTRLIEEKRENGVFLTVLGFGMGNNKDSRMEKLADRGNGNYGYIDTIDEARKVMVKEAGATLVTVAKDVKFQIEWNPAKVAGYRLVGYENRLLRNEDFNDDKKDAGDIGAGHTVTALYEVVPAGVAVPNENAGKVDALKYQKPAVGADASNSDELATVKIRYKAPDAGTSKLLSKTVAVTASAFAAASINVRWAASVASYGMLLRGSKHVGAVGWGDVAKMATAARGPDSEGYRREFLLLLDQAARLSSPTMAVGK